MSPRAFSLGFLSSIGVPTPSPHQPPQFITGKDVSGKKILSVSGREFGDGTTCRAKGFPMKNQCGECQKVSLPSAVGGDP